MDRVGYGVGIWGWIDVLKKNKGMVEKTHGYPLVISYSVPIGTHIISHSFILHMFF